MIGESERDREALSRRILGIPLLFAVAYSAVGFTIYFSLGVVAQRGLGLTPLLFLGAGLMLVLATMSFAEGGSMFVGRGGSSNLARHGFNELVSFVAGWALLIDFILVIALAAVSAPHYLAPIWDGFAEGTGEVLTAVGIVFAVAAWNAFARMGERRQRLLVALAIGDLVVQALVIVVGLFAVLEPEALTRHLDLFGSPSLEDAIYALVIATVAFAGIEAAADVAPDVDWDPRALRRSLGVGVALLPVLYAAVAAIALMAVPVVIGPGGEPGTALGGAYIEDPVLGIAESFEPEWVSDLVTAAVVLVAPAVLVWAASTGMLGLSRHVYTLARNRQIPSWLGKLSRRNASPHVAIAAAAVIAAALVIPGDIEVLAAIYAFGATLSIAIAHAAVIRMRIDRPDAERAYRIPLNLRVGKVDWPLPAVAGLVLTAGAWVSVIAFHEEARWVGGGWMAFGIAGYVIYRKVFQGTSLTKRVVVPEKALLKDVAETEYNEILVPIFGTPLDDDIVGTAGRLAAAAVKGGTPPRLRVIYVVDLPLSVSMGAPPPAEEMAMASRALERAELVGAEYETVEVNTAVIKARDVGAGIVQAARDLGVEAVVMGAEPPTRIKGGAMLGGIGGARPAEMGPVTEHVLRRAPCPVLVIAPPEDVVEELAPDRAGSRE